MIPKPNDRKTAFAQICRPFSILFNGIQMLSAVQLYHQILFKAHKIYDVVADGVLASESVAVKLTGAEGRPERLFTVGLVLPECSGSCCF